MAKVGEVVGEGVGMVCEVSPVLGVGGWAEETVEGVVLRAGGTVNATVGGV